MWKPVKVSLVVHHAAGPCPLVPETDEALPGLSVLTLTPATSAKLGKRHRTMIQASHILIWLMRRWHPQREVVLIGDGGFAATGLGHTRRDLRVGFVSRRLVTDQFYDPVPAQSKGKLGIKPNKCLANEN